MEEKGDGQLAPAIPFAYLRLDRIFFSCLEMTQMRNVSWSAFLMAGALGLLGLLPSAAAQTRPSFDPSNMASLRLSIPSLGESRITRPSISSLFRGSLSPTQTPPPSPSPSPNPVSTLPPIDTVQLFIMGGFLVGGLLVGIGDMVTRRMGGDPLVWQILGLVLNAANIAYSCYLMSQFSFGGDPLYQVLFWSNLVFGGVSFLWGVVSLILQRTARPALPAKAPAPVQPTSPGQPPTPIPTQPQDASPTPTAPAPPSSTFSWSVSPWFGISPTTRAAEGGFALVGEF